MSHRPFVIQTSNSACAVFGVWTAPSGLEKDCKRKRRIAVMYGKPALLAPIADDMKMHTSGTPYILTLWCRALRRPAHVFPGAGTHTVVGVEAPMVQAPPFPVSRRPTPISDTCSGAQPVSGGW